MGVWGVDVGWGIKGVLGMYERGLVQFGEKEQCCRMDQKVFYKFFFFWYIGIEYKKFRKENIEKGENMSF